MVTLSVRRLEFPRLRSWLITLVVLQLLMIVPHTAQEVEATEWSSPYAVASGSVEPFAEMAAEGDHVYVVYVQQMRDEYYIYLRWFDGARWSAALRVSELSSTDATTPVIAVTEGVAHIAYVDRTDGDSDVKYTSFNGTTFTAVQQVSSALGRTNAIDPSIAADGSNVHIVWEEVLLSDQDIYYRGFISGRWTPIGEVSSDAGTEYQWDPSVAADNGMVHVVWAGPVGADQDLFYRRWTGSGWDDEVNLNPAMERSSDKAPHVDAEGDDVHVAYESWSSMSTAEVHMVTYVGGRWGTGASVATLAGNEVGPRVAVEHGHVALTYRNMNVYSSTYFQHFNGTDWSAPEVVATGDADNFRYPTDIDLADGKVHLTYLQQGQSSRTHFYTTGDLDKADPEASVGPVDPYWMDAGRNSLTWTASDDYGLDRVTVQYRYSTDNMTWDRWTEVATITGIAGMVASDDVSFTAAEGDGFYEFKAYAVDVTGKAEAPSIEPEAMGALDTVAPTGSIVINGGEPYTTNETLNISVNFADETAGVLSIRFGEDAIGGDEPWENPVPTKEWTVPSVEGEHTIAYQVMDRSGQLSPVYTDTIYLDLADPYGTITMTLAQEWTTSPDVDLTLTYGDTGSGVNMVRFGEEAIGGDEPWENPVPTKEWTLPSVEGMHTIAYQVMDAAGRTSEIYTVSIGLDTVAPSGSIVIEGVDTLTAERTVTLTLTAEDTTSGVAGIRVTNEAIGGDEPWEDKVDSLAWELTEGSGLKTVYYQVLDVAGLTSQVYTASITLDLDEPTATIALTSAAPVVNTATVTLSLSYSDATSDVVGIRVSEEAIGGDEPWENPVESLEFQLSAGDGEKTIYLQVVDEAGHESLVNSTTFTLDTTNPFVESSEPEDLAEKVPVDRAITVRFSEAMATTATEAAFSLSFDKDGAATEVVGTFDWSTDGKTLTFTPAEDLERGTRYTIGIDTDATDGAGNGLFPAASRQFTTAGDSGDGDDGDDGDEGTPWGLVAAIVVVVAVLAVALGLLMMRGKKA